MTGLQRRHRREVHLWSDEEWGKYARALKTLKDSGTYTSYVKLHPSGHPHDQPELMNLQLLPWHRRFIFDFETDLQKVAKDCLLSLPFWNAHLESSNSALWSSEVWSPSRLGGQPYCPDGSMNCAEPEVRNSQRCASDPERWCLGDGVAGGWTIDEDFAESQRDKTGGCSCLHRSPNTRASLTPFPTLFASLQNRDNFKNFSDSADQFHVQMHCDVPGGKSTMCPATLTNWDPLFYMHHTNVDRMFHLWQRYHFLKSGIDTTTCAECGMRMTVYDQPLGEWFGLHDSVNKCIQLPKTSPVACVSYEGLYDFGHAKFGDKASQPSVSGGDEGGGSSAYSFNEQGEAWSSNCQQALSMMQSPACDPAALQSSIQRTCPMPDNDASIACKAWYEGMGLDAQTVSTNVQRCVERARTLFQREQQRTFVQPQNEEESRLCFKCNLRCVKML